MAVGDDAVAAGFAVVPNTGEEGRARWGAREINRTRDYVAQVKTNVTSLLGRVGTLEGVRRGEFNGSVSSASPAVVFHGLGFTPSQIIISQRVAAYSNVFFIQEGYKDMAAFKVYAYRFNGANLTSTALSFDWVAYK